MSIKLIFTFLLLSALSTYFAFLNPNQVEIRLTQALVFEVPQIVFLLGSALLGTLVASFFYWTNNFGHTFQIWRMKNRYRGETINREKIEKLYESGEIAFHAGKIDKATPYFEKVLRKSPTHVGAMYFLGIILRKLGKLDEAKRLHYKAISIKKDNPRILCALAEDYIESEQADKAIITLEKLRFLDQNALNPLCKIRDYHIKNGNWDQARLTQKSLLSLLQNSGRLEEEQNKFSEIIFTKAMDYYKNGRTSEAIEELKFSLTQNKCSLPAYVALGDIYLEIDNVKQAVKVWKAGFNKTGAPICLQRIHLGYKERSHFKDIVKMYKNAIKSSRNQNRETLELMLGIIFLNNNMPEKTIDLLKVSEVELSLAKRVLLADAYEILNESNKAAEITQKLLKDIQDSIKHYNCRKCQANFIIWSGFCPKCNSWDSIQQGTLLKDIKLHPTKTKSSEKAA